MEKKKYYNETIIVKLGIDLQDSYGYINYPIIQGSTNIYSSVEEMYSNTNVKLKNSKFSYGRFGSPTSKNFENVMAQLEHGYGAITTSSGLSAITIAIMAFAKCNDHILIVDTVYSSTRKFCSTLSDFGIEVEYYNPNISTDISDLFKENTKLVFMESPGSNTFEVQDIKKIASVCKQNGITTIIDNTWATPILCNPILLGVDIVVHSATKYIIGQGDGILGVIICNNEENYTIVKEKSNIMGQFTSSHTTYQALQGLRTLSLRLKQVHLSAVTIIKWFATRKEVKNILYPYLNNNPYFNIWKDNYFGASGVFSIVFDETISKESIINMINELKIFNIGFGWGGFESLIVPCFDTYEYRIFKTQNEKIVRLSVGFENESDLINDLKQAFNFLKIK